MALQTDACLSFILILFWGRECSASEEKKTLCAPKACLPKQNLIADLKLKPRLIEKNNVLCTKGPVYQIQNLVAGLKLKLRLIISTWMQNSTLGAWKQQ